MRVTGRVSGARPRLIRALNERLLLDRIRDAGPCSKAELARESGLSKATVSIAMANLERTGLVRAAGRRHGMPGRAAQLYEITPDAGFVLALDVGRHHLRGALADLTGAIVAREDSRASAGGGADDVDRPAALAGALLAAAGIAATAVTQAVVACPGVYDPASDTIRLTGALTGWTGQDVPARLRAAFGDTVIIANDVDAAALAEQAHGHGRDVGSFAYVSLGTGVGMSLVLDGRPHRGAHGVAGEIAFLPLDEEPEGTGPAEARTRGRLEAAAGAAGVARAARRAGLRGPVTARRVFEEAARGDPRAARVVAAEARLVARAVCAIVAVADPEIVVLGGGIGRAPGFADAVAAHLATLAPVVPPVLVSALGADAAVDGCLAAGRDRAWEIASAPVSPPPIHPDAP